MKTNEITEKIIAAAYQVSNTLGTGFLEKVYENALRIELEKQGFKVEQQKTITVFYGSEPVGEYFADLFIENKIIIELKAVKEIIHIHHAQLMNYLRACNIQVGLIINFGNPKVEIKRMVNGF